MQECPDCKGHGGETLASFYREGDYLEYEGDSWCECSRCAGEGHYVPLCTYCDKPMPEAEGTEDPIHPHCEAEADREQARLEGEARDIAAWLDAEDKGSCRDCGAPADGAPGWCTIHALQRSLLQVDVVRQYAKGDSQ